MCKSNRPVLLLLSWVLSGPPHFLRRCQALLQLLLPETSATEFPSWQDFLQIPRWDSAACFSNVDIALTCLANHSPHSSLMIGELWFSMPCLIPCRIFVPCYDLNVRMLSTFYKLQTEIMCYWTAPFFPSRSHFAPVQQSVWGTETDLFHFVFEIWPRFCSV